MEKETVELLRMSGSINGYGFLFPPYSQDAVKTLEALLDWAQKPENTNKKVYRHFLRGEEENTTDRVYKYFADGGEVTKENYENLKAANLHAYVVYYCDYVYYLDICYQ